MPPKRPLHLKTYSKRPRRRRRLDPHLPDTPPETPAGSLGQSSARDELRSMSFVPSKHEPEPLRPRSQKAATMSVEPTDEQIATLVSFTGADEVTARRYLRVKQCDVETAVNAIFDGEDITKLESGISWDSNLMTADRDGNSNLHPLGTSTAPTRGNSPAPSLKESAPTNSAAEDADLARALAQSEEMSGPYAGWQQETGTVSKDGTELKRIGPATAQEYQESQWGMVVHNSSELVPDVPIEERTQQEGDAAPRFLKHTLTGDYTPNLITICHSIPMAREAFLLASRGIADYGYDADWWKGASVPKPRIVHTDSGDAADQATDRFDEFVAELQRLTAFLDCSSRVYASTGGLAQTDVMKDYSSSPRSDGMLEHFLDSYTQIVGARGGDQSEQIAGLFTTHAGVIGQPGGDKDSTRALLLRSSCADEVPEEAKPDLAECLDRLFWSTDTDDPDPRQYYLDRPANILVVRLEQQDKSASHLNVRVPATLVMDKYIEENVPVTRDLREQLIQSKRHIKKITEAEKKLSLWEKDGKQLNARQLLKHTYSHFSGQNRKDVDQADKTNNASLSAEQPPHYAGIAQQLETVMASIDQKLKLLAEERERARRAISDLSKSTIPGLEAQESQYRYTLRGVATKPNITYVLRPKTGQDEPIVSAYHNETVEQNEVMNDAATQDEENTTPADHQWWRIDYEVTGQTARLRRTKADDFDVIRAVELEHSSALLVYANDDAVDDLEPSALPPALAEFIRKDNEQLQVDIEASKRNPPPPYQDQNPLPNFVRASVEACNRDDDDDADSTRVQLDGSDYETTGNTVTMVDHAPRLSPDSWMDHENPYRQHGEVSMGYDIGQKDPPPIDIHLGPDNDILPKASAQGNYMDGADEGKEMEMMEKKGMRSLIPAPGSTANRQMSPSAQSGDDMGMGGMGESQDFGIGDPTSHVEEVRKGG